MNFRSSDFLQGYKHQITQDLTFYQEMLDAKKQAYSDIALQIRETEDMIEAIKWALEQFEKVENIKE